MTAPSPPRLTLLRHGKSVWNQQNRFTGWEDVPLSPAGIAEARAAARAMRRANLAFDMALVSNLKRAIATLWLVLEEMDTMWLPQTSDWRLNERHYGALQGKNKAEATAEHGAEQIHQWRRGITTPPPPHPGPQPLLAGVPPPTGESLQDILPRLRAVYTDRITPALTAGQSVLIVAHGNSLRALIKLIENTDDTAITQTELPTATPWTYQFTPALTPTQKRILTPH